MASPVVQNQRPADGDALVAPRQPAYLEITDADNDLVAASVIIKYNGRVAWSGDAAQSGFSVTKTAITNGFSYSVTPHTLPGRGTNVQIDVYADDGVNTVTDVYHYGLGSREYQHWYDGFDDASIDSLLTVVAGNGIVTEPAGTELKLDCPNSVSCNWWTSVYTAPHVFFPTPSWLLDKPDGVFQLTAKLSNLVDTTANVLAGIVLHVDAQNAYFGAFHESPNDHRFERGVANVFGNRWNSSDSRPHPSGGNTIYRIVWNDTQKTFRLLDGSLLDPGDITFYYSENNGSSWVRAYTEAMAISAKGLAGVGVWMKKWDATAVNAQAYFDWAEFTELLPDPELELNESEVGGVIEIEATGQIRSEADADTQALDRGAEGHIEIDNRVAPDEQPLDFARGAAGHIEILAEAFLSVATDYRTDTNDFNGHPHFLGERVLDAFVYHADDEAGPWTTPTDPSFTGYGKDGNYYVNGVDQGTNAPWYDEAESDDRGPTKPFPDKALICYTATGISLTPAEVVIFDLDNFPTTLNVWMRFKFGPSGGNYTMLGRINQKVTNLAMANGILGVVTTEGDYRGALHLINFTQPGNNCAHYIRSNNHYHWIPVTEIAGRNLTGAAQWSGSPSPQLRTDEEQIHSVAMLADGDDTWAAIGGEDPGPNLYKITTQPIWRVQGSGPNLGSANIGNKRRMAFDEDKNWWLTIEDRIHRVLEYDYKEGYTNISTAVLDHRVGAARAWIRLPYDITDFCAVGDYLFVATEGGVYRVHRGSMEYSLAYTIVGGGGGGTSDSPPAGELIPGDRPEVIWIRGHALNSAHYLHVATPTSVATIRTLDDVAVDSRNFPELHWPNPHFNTVLVV